jgi:hypothetical protein
MTFYDEIWCTKKLREILLCSRLNEYIGAVTISANQITRLTLSMPRQNYMVLRLSCIFKHPTVQIRSSYNTNLQNNNITGNNKKKTYVSKHHGNSYLHQHLVQI